MTNVVFEAWPKTPRLFRDSIITEKIDGTNAAVCIVPFDPLITAAGNAKVIELDGTAVCIYAQSRNRIITPLQDNYGFATWVAQEADSLVHDFGLGRHYGEWWGEGIQRGYGVAGKWFSLFNTERHKDAVFATHHLGTVPVLTRGTFNTDLVLSALDDLRDNGSRAAPGWKPAEGVCVYHAASRQIFKATLESDQLPKSVTVTSVTADGETVTVAPGERYEPVYRAPVWKHAA